MMKNRRIILIAFLLCSCMIVGLGYAAYTEVLDINGTAELSADQVHDANVYFSKAVAVETGDGAQDASGNPIKNTANVNPNNPDKASFTVNTIAHQGQSAKFVFTITNGNDEAYNVRVKAYTTNADAKSYYSITSDLDDTQDGDPVTIEANDTLEVTVTVEMFLQPEDGVENVSASFLLELEVSEIPVP